MTSPLELIYEKYKHLDGPLSDTEWCNAGIGAIYPIAGELWRAVKEARENPCDEICQHSRIYSPIQMQQAIAQAREQFAALIMRESPDTMQATELDGDLHAWNGETIMRVLNRLAQPEPTERDPE